MKQNDCDNFPDTVIIGSSTLYPLAQRRYTNADIIYYYYYLNIKCPSIMKPLEDGQNKKMYLVFSFYLQLCYFGLFQSDLFFKNIFYIIFY